VLIASFFEYTPQPQSPFAVIFQAEPRPSPALAAGVHPMPKYVIERDIPGAGRLSPAELTGISQKSCSVLSGMGPQIQWVHSYVTGDRIYCVYIAPNEDMVREHRPDDVRGLTSC
jgi:hypothetical protein